MQCLELGDDDAIHSCFSNAGSDLKRIRSWDTAFWKKVFGLFDTKMSKSYIYIHYGIFTIFLTTVVSIFRFS